MTELLPLSIGLGLFVGFLFGELFGLASAGLIVPGYFALYLTKPWDILLTLAISFVTYVIVQTLSSVLILYGRRRTALMILFGYLLGMLAQHWPNLPTSEYNVIGYIIPGLIALWMDRQGVLQTLASLFIMSGIVRLLLILLVGMEVPA